MLRRFISFTERCSSFPTSPQLLFILATCEASQNNPAAAENALLSALRCVPNEPAYLSCYAVLVAETGQLEKATQIIEEAARIDPEAPSVRSAQIFIYYLQGNDRQVARLSRKQLHQEPVCHLQLDGARSAT